MRAAWPHRSVSRADSRFPVIATITLTMGSNASGAVGCLRRRMRCLIVACGAVTSVRVADAQSPPHALTTLPAGDPAYAQLAALDRVGCRSARISPHRPFYVRDVQRAIARFPENPACAGPVASALAARFTRRPAPDLPHDVATDLAAAVRESAKDTLETFRVGGQATLRGTALKRGEFEPLWAGVRPRDEGTPPVVADARVRAGWSASDKLVIVGELYGQTSQRNDPTVRRRAGGRGNRLFSGGRDSRIVRAGYAIGRRVWAGNPGARTARAFPRGSRVRPSRRGRRRRRSSRA